MFVIFALLSNVTGVVIRDSHILSGQLYTHLAPDTSLANTRVLTIGVSGLVGGPAVALVVGLISGIYRFYIGGANAFYLFHFFHTYCFGFRLRRTVLFKSSTLSTYFTWSTRRRFFRNYTDALYLNICRTWRPCMVARQFIALPMILINSIGTAIFFVDYHFNFEARRTDSWRSNT